MSKKREKLKFVALNKSTRKRAALSVRRIKDQVFHEDLMFDEIKSAFQNRVEGETIYATLKQVDLRNVLKGFTKFNQKNDCQININRKGWIYKNEKGEHVYYSKAGSHVLMFDLFDILSVYLAQTERNVLKFIEENWLLEDKVNWKNQQQGRHDNNIEVMKNIASDKKSLPNLHRLLGKKIEVLEAVNTYAFEKMVKKAWYWKGQPLFFVSTHYLRDTYLPTTSTSTINNILNTLCVLGAMEKIPTESIPLELQDRATYLAGAKQQINTVSFYILHDFKQVLGNMESQARILVDHKLYYHRITKKSIKEVFGQAFHDTIFTQKTYGKTAKGYPVFVENEDEQYTEKDRIERIFLREINEKGICERSTLEKETLLPYARFLLLWEELVEKHGCESVVSDTQMMRIREKKKSFIYARKKSDMPIYLSEGNTPLRHPYTYELDFTKESRKKIA